ncbi:MAG: GNAT family N-acetyltransferase [Lachnospiraceae bacterium]|nr:GNAT family N-acetyltransferase [Lachnospiraceae bacterium]
MDIKIKKKLNKSEYRNALALYNNSAAQEDIFISPPSADAPADMYILAYVGENLAGYFLVDLFEPYAEVRAMVDPAFRRQGIFYAMKNKLEDELDDEYELLFITDNKSAAALHMIKKYHLREQQAQIGMERELARQFSTDVTAVPATDREEFLKYCNEGFSDELLPEEIDECTSFPDSSSARFLLFKKGDAIIGSCILSIKGRNALLSFFSITKNCRGLGYGHGAVRAVFNYALENGCRHIALNVSSDNKPALKTYKKAGFKEALRISMFCDFINVD